MGEKKNLKEKEKEKAAYGWKVKIQENKEGGLRHSIGGEDYAFINGQSEQSKILFFFLNFTEILFFVHEVLKILFYILQNIFSHLKVIFHPYFCLKTIKKNFLQSLRIKKKTFDKI